VPETARAYSPFLLYEQNLGIPQKPLYKAYLAAVHIFGPPSHRINLPDVTIISATAVILLTNPAHTTALHARKHLVMKNILRVDKELDFFSLLLCGVKDAAKQDILWHHRRWLYLTLTTDHSQTSWEDFTSFDPASARCEFDLVANACELYPRNYHAWTHRYLCLRAMRAHSGYASHLKSEIMWTQAWIESHVSDHSAVHYLMNIATELKALGHDARGIDGQNMSLLQHASDLVSRYPDHEALWMYLRYMFQESKSTSDKILTILQSIRLNEHPYASKMLSYLERSQHNP
jgi:protein prenyltransferase alpha subunit repeat containing protein 1